MTERPCVAAEPQAPSAREYTPPQIGFLTPQVAARSLMAAVRRLTAAVQQPEQARDGWEETHARLCRDLDQAEQDAAVVSAECYRLRAALAQAEPVRARAQARTEAAAYRYWLRNTAQSLAEEKARHARLLSAVDQAEQDLQTDHAALVQAEQDRDDEKRRVDHFHAEYWRMHHDLEPVQARAAALEAVAQDALRLAAVGRYLEGGDGWLSDRQGRDTPEYQRLVAALPMRAEAP